MQALCSAALLNNKTMNSNDFLMASKIDKSYVSFLSPDIKKLYDRSITKCNVYHNQCSMDSLLKNWDLNHGSFFDVSATVFSKEWYKDCIFNINQMLNDIEQNLHELSSDLLCKWNFNNDVNMKSALLYLHDKDDNSGYYLLLLLASAALERLLGDIFLLHGRQVPFLLKDLIDTDTIKTFLGENLVKFLKVLLGSVKGLNLRNIAWHGFFAPGDIKAEYSVIVLLSYYVCIQIVQEKNYTIVPRQSIEISPIVLSLEEHFYQSDFNEAVFFIQSSPFVIGNETHWLKVVSLLKTRDFNALVLLLPLMENSLRCIYAEVNGFPSRVLTASESTFYTTFDEILSPWISSSDKNVDSASNSVSNLDQSLNLSDRKVNLVPQVLGRQLTEALLDSLQYLSGPRIRDRLSHGEVSPKTIPFSFIDYLFRLAVLSLSVHIWRANNKQFSIYCRCENFETNSNASSGSCSNHYSSKFEVLVDKYLNSKNASTSSENTSDYLNKAVEILCQYQSVFHPISHLKLLLLEMLNKFATWRQFSRPSSCDLDYVTWEDLSHPSSLSSDLSLSLLSSSISLKEFDEQFLQDISISSLFSSKRELELTGILQRITSSIQISLTNIENSLQLKLDLFLSKRLRSRQRISYCKMLDVMPSLMYNVEVTIATLCLLFKSTNEMYQLTSQRWTDVRQMLKKLLKATENLVSFTHINVNKYSEAVILLDSNTKMIENFLK